MAAANQFDPRPPATNTPGDATLAWLAAIAVLLLGTSLVLITRQPPAIARPPVALSIVTAGGDLDHTDPAMTPDATVRLWNGAGERPAVLQTAAVDHHVAVRLDSGRVIVRDLLAPPDLNQRIAWRAGGGRAHAIALDAGGGYVAYVLDNGRLLVSPLDADGRRQIWQFDENSGGALAVAIDDGHLSFLLEDGSVRTTDPGPTGAVNSDTIELVPAPQAGAPRPTTLAQQRDMAIIGMDDGSLVVVTRAGRIAESLPRPDDNLIRSVTAVDSFAFVLLEDGTLERRPLDALDEVDTIWDPDTRPPAVSVDAGSTSVAVADVLGNVHTRSRDADQGWSRVPGPGRLRRAIGVDLHA